MENSKKRRKGEDEFLPFEAYENPENYDAEGNFIDPRDKEPPEPPEDEGGKPPGDEWPLDRVITYLNENQPITIRDCVEGICTLGGIGSGKTSGSGRHFALAFLRAGFGGLVLCAKKGEAAAWREYAKLTGREKSIIEFNPISGEWCFPFLEYEARRKGEGAGYTENIVRLLMTAQEAIERGNTDGEEAFWKRELAKLLRNAVDLLLLANRPISIPALAELVEHAPMSEEQALDESWLESSKLYQIIKEGDQLFDGRSKWEKADFDTAVTYWLEQFPAMPEKQRGSTLSMFTGLIDLFMRRPFRQLFGEKGGGKRVLVPELSFSGMIILLNFPVKEFGDSGRAAQVVYKYLWQQAMERRPPEKKRPVFLWVDEAQNFATEYDQQFQATARSSLVCTHYLSQNLPNYYAEIRNKYRVISLIGNLQLKISHANGDPETNTTVSDTIGKSWQEHINDSITTSTTGSEGGVNVGESRHFSFDYDVPPQVFTRLAKGGPGNDFIVQAIVFQTGRMWNDGDNFLIASFNQKSN